MKYIFIIAFLIVSLWAGNFEKAVKAYNSKKYNKAIEFLKLSAEEGNLNAPHNLGYMYHNGKGVNQDYEQALKWYKLSAEKGNSNSQLNIGSMYDKGEGVNQNDNKAKELFGKACDGGNANGCKGYALLNKK